MCVVVACLHGLQTYFHLMPHVCMFVCVSCRLIVSKGKGHFDHRVDVYSLAVTIHMVLTNKSPLYYDGKNLDTYDQLTVSAWPDLTLSCIQSWDRQREGRGRGTRESVRGGTGLRRRRA